jgi:hypothetical protein
VSQAGVASSTSGPVPPQVPTSFVTDSGTAIPAANVLNVNTGFTTANNNNGITAIANPNNSNNILINLTNRLEGSVVTVGATSSNVISFTLGLSPGTYLFNILIVGFDRTNSFGAGYNTNAVVRTDGITATSIANTESVTQEDNEFTPAEVGYTLAGNTINVNVTGIAGATISWLATGYYIVTN